MRLSVIIPTYNRAKLLTLTLGSLFQQTLEKKDYEVIVADDGSTDETPKLVNGFGERHLRYLWQPDHGYRVAAARNMGIRAAQAPLCVFLDSGMLAAPDFLEQHLASHLAARAPIAVVGSIPGLDQHGNEHHQSNDARIISLIDATDVVGSIIRLEKAGFEDIRESRFFRRYGDEIDQWPAPWIVFWTGNASLPTGLLRDMGLFDEAFLTWGGEDVDLGLRLFQRGVPIVLNRAAKAIHHPHRKALSGLPVEEQLSWRRATLQYVDRKHNTRHTHLLLNTRLEDINDVLRPGPDMVADEPMVSKEQST